MPSASDANLVVVGGLPIRGIEVCTVTIGLLNAFEKTKSGKMEQTVFAARFRTRLMVDNKAVTYYDTVESLKSQCHTIMVQHPEEQGRCLSLSDTCEEMLRIAKSPVSWCAKFVEHPREVRDRIYEMVIGEAKSIIHHCNNAYHDQVSCPAGYCEPSKDYLGERDLKEALALARTCKQIKSELLKLLYQDNVLHFSCTCSLALCLSKNELVRQNVQRLRLHLRGPQFSEAISLLRLCSNLKHLEVTVSKWSTFYNDKSNSPFGQSSRLAAAWSDPPLKTARGVADLLEIQYLESVKATPAKVDNIPDRDEGEVERFETYLKERLEGRGLLRYSIAELNDWLDRKIQIPKQ